MEEKQFLFAESGKINFLRNLRSYNMSFGDGFGAGCGYKITEILFSALGFAAIVGALLIYSYCNNGNQSNSREQSRINSSNLNSSKMNSNKVSLNANIPNKPSLNTSSNTNQSKRPDNKAKSNTNLPSESNSATNSAGDIYATVNVQELDLLADPKINSYKLGNLKQGDRVALIAPTLCKTCYYGNGWYHVKLLSLDLDGWIEGDGISFE